MGIEGDDAVRLVVGSEVVDCEVVLFGVDGAKIVDGNVSMLRRWSPPVFI